MHVSVFVSLTLRPHIFSQTQHSLLDVPTLFPTFPLNLLQHILYPPSSQIHCYHIRYPPTSPTLTPCNHILFPPTSPTAKCASPSARNVILTTVRGMLTTLGLGERSSRAIISPPHPPKSLFVLLLLVHSSYPMVIQSWISGDN